MCITATITIAKQFLRSCGTYVVSCFADFVKVRLWSTPTIPRTPNADSNSKDVHIQSNLRVRAIYLSSYFILVRLFGTCYEYIRYDDWPVVAYWRHMAPWTSVKIGSGNGLSPDAPSHHLNRCWLIISVAFIWEQFDQKFSRTLSVIRVRILHF